MKERIAYVCDRKRCERCSPECHHTTDIHHAVNFTKQEGADDCWMENMDDEFKELCSFYEELKAARRDD